MGVADILIFGVGIVGVGVLVAGAVMLELRAKAPGAGVLMGVGLGLGILAFSAKLLLIVAFGLLGDRYLAAFLPRDLQPEPYSHATASVGDVSAASASYLWQALPRVPPQPRDNPTTPAKVELGRRLFHDPRLSANDQVACASCHDIGSGAGADGRPASVGIDGQVGTRNAPTVLNAAYQAVLFWDGRAASLEAQAVGPLMNPVEMGMADARAVVRKVASISAYREAFRHVFGGERPVTLTNIAKAIAAYERTLVTPSAPYDRFVRGDRNAMSEQQVRGMALFAEFGCVACHRGPNFSDAALVGGSAPFRAFPAVPGSAYETRYHLVDDTGLADGDGAERGVWRVPSLRNVSRTAPYFHNGSVETLEEAVRVMARVQLDKPASNRQEDDWQVRWSPERHTTGAAANAVISDAEVKDIVAFLHALEADPAPAETVLAHWDEGNQGRHP